MKFKSAICTSVEQSKRLLELGLKKETADMYITNISQKGINYTDDWQIGTISYCDAISFWDSKGLQLEKTAWSIIPAWSLHRLMEILSYTPELSDFAIELQYDAMVIHIANAIEANNINKDYLEDKQ